MHWHWHCIEFCIVIVLAFFVGRGPYSWSRVATLGRGQLAPQLGVFFREASQLRGRILGAFGLRIEYSVLNAIVMLLAFERRVESRRIIMLVLTLMGRIE